MPLVPLASYGRSGLLSHTSQPEVSMRPTSMSYSSMSATRPWKPASCEKRQIICANSWPPMSLGCAFPAKTTCTGRSLAVRMRRMRSTSWKMSGARL